MKEGLIMIKRVISAVLAVMTAAMLLPFSVSAAGNMKLEAKSVSASAAEGTVVKVPVSFSGNPGYGYGYVSVSWSSKALKLNDVEYTDIAPRQDSAAPIENNGSYKVSFGDMMTLDPFKGNGTAFTLVFEVAKNAAAGSYEINLFDAEIYDVDINAISATANGVKISLKNDGNSSKAAQSSAQSSGSKGSGSKASDKQSSASSQGKSSQSGSTKSSQAAPVGNKLSLSANSAFAENKAGSTIKVPVSFLENPGYSYGYVTVKWDKNALTLKDIDYSDLAPKQSGNAKIENSGSYKVAFGSMNSDAAYTGTGTAFTLVFTVNDAAKANAYSISFDDMEVYDKNINAVKCLAMGGTVDLSGKEHTHKLNKIEKTEPSCDSEGVEEYYRCETCGKLFSDKEGTKEIDKPSTVSATGHKLKKVDGKDDDYVCEKCGMHFRDSKGEIAIDSTDASAGNSKAARKDSGNGLAVIFVCIGGAIILGSVGAFLMRRKLRADSDEEDSDPDETYNDEESEPEE